MAENSAVIEVHSRSALEKILSSGLVMVDYSATWCGSCKKFAPKYEKLAKCYSGVKFVKVDVNVIAANEIRNVPTFKFYRDGREIGMVLGANEEKVVSLLQSQ